MAVPHGIHYETVSEYPWFLVFFCVFGMIMVMEELNKTQIVLLVLLVSFVTSIATGIVTVTLMDQAPQSVTRTINKVVEHTIERVVPQKTQNATATVVETVLIEKSDSIADVVSENTSHIVKIYKDSINETATSTEHVFVATGFPVTTHEFVTDSDLVAEGISYRVLYNGVSHRATLLGQDETRGVALFRIEISEDEQVLSPAVLKDSDAIRLGQDVILLGGGENEEVATGIIAKLDMRERDTSDDETAHVTPYLYAIIPNVSLSKENSGSMALDSEGNIIGMTIIRDEISSIVPAEYLKNFLASLPEDKEQEDQQAEEN